MKIKKLFTFLLLGVILVLVSCGGTKAKSLEAIQKSGKIVVATNAEFAPFEFKDGAEFKGIDMEIIRAYAESINVECEIADQEFDAALLSVQTNKADLAIAGITKNSKREEVLTFTDSYFTASQVVTVKNDSAMKDLTTDADILAALVGKKIGVQRGTTGEYFASGDADWGYDGISNATVTSYDNGAQAMMALNNGQVDAVILDQAPSNVISAKYADLKVLSAVLTNEEYAIAVDKGNTSLVESLNAFLKTIKSNGKFDEIVNNYYAK